MRRDRSGRQAAGCAPDDALLLDVARHSIERGLAVGQAEPVDLADCPAALRKPGACFVTLRGPAKELRGCIGTLEPHRSLVEDVAGNAYAAAFHDPRMEVVTVEEIADLQIEISLLGPLVELAVRSFEDLLARPQPGRDGPDPDAPGPAPARARARSAAGGSPRRLASGRAAAAARPD